MLKNALSTADIFRRLLLSWLVSVCLCWTLLPGDVQILEDLAGLSQLSLPRMGIVWAAVFALLTVLGRYVSTEKAERWALLCTWIALAALVLTRSFSWAFLGACALVGLILTVYALLGWQAADIPATPGKKAHWGWILAAGAVVMGVFGVICFWTVGRVRNFNTPTYDFGLFCQMFHSMAKTGLPVTTLERDGLLSHFAVHVSPVYYLMLPFYWLIPRPETLQVLQGAVVVSAVIPVWKLGTHHGLSPMVRTLMCAASLLLPAVAGGTGYDLHENCFLLPLLLWLFYGIDRQSTRITALAALLTLGVKEDAPVYVAVVGLYLLVRGLLRKGAAWDLAAGGCLLAGALGWFFLATGYLASQGEGVMTYRYENFMYDGSDSLVTVVKSVVLQPMKALYECVDPEKLPFLGLTLLPLLGLPLLTRRFERYILLIPYILVNLMSDYRYQHDIFFQYTFGSTGCLVYLALVNLAQLRRPWLRTGAAWLCAAACAVSFCTTVLPRAIPQGVSAVQSAEETRQIRQVLEQIPEDAAVTAGTFYTTALSRREVLYDLRYARREHLLESEYVVVDPTVTGDFKNYGDGRLESLHGLLLGQGYRVEYDNGKDLRIYRKGQ